MSRNGLPERLALGEFAKVEALAPSILVEVRGEVVVVSGQCGVLCTAGFTGLFCLLGGGLVVPVLEVLVYGFVLCLVVFAEDGIEAGFAFTGVTVKRFLEGGVSVEVLFLEDGGSLRGRHGCVLNA